MTGKKFKFIYVPAIILVAILVYAASGAGISCDEILHYDHSVDVYNYFATGGTDKSALETPVTNLKYYGQSYDNFVTFVTKWIGIEDVYSFRNIMSALMGGLVILVTALFAVRTRNLRTGLLTILLLAITPAFIGHSFNNLKDIPFAFGYISGIIVMLRYLNRNMPEITDGVLLMLTMAFCISIRAGGIILICYLYLFLFVKWAIQYFRGERIGTRVIIINLAAVTIISSAAYFLSAVFLWPFALQDPFNNILTSYRVMAHFPSTFRQLFEGEMVWSDHMPWYYILKSMAITIPVLVLSGLLIFFILIRRALTRNNLLIYFSLLFSLIFPLIFVMISRSNLYSSWRQFLFLYPVVVILAAAGLDMLMEFTRSKILVAGILCLMIFLSIHPLKFMIANHPYEYIYHNEFAGGTRGAYGNYELDYYYVSHKEASEWLTDYLEKYKPGIPQKIMAAFPVDWFFRENSNIKVSSGRYEERSMLDWDFFIAVNRYVSAHQIKTGIFPPKNAIHVIYTDSVPVCAVLQRQSKNDLEGYKALTDGRYDEAIQLFKQVSGPHCDDEMILYNYGAALYFNGQKEEAYAELGRALQLNPSSEPVLMFLGNIAVNEKKYDSAISYYRQVINTNLKYFEAYVALAELIAVTDLIEARKLLRECLMLNPSYRPALIALGDTYSKTNRDIAEKYYELANINH